jgi:hypothetical protein
MECLTCHKARRTLGRILLIWLLTPIFQTSTTYNPFMYLSLPIPPSRGGRVALQTCLDALVNKEVMTGSEAW